MPPQGGDFFSCRHLPKLDRAAPPLPFPRSQGGSIGGERQRAHTNDKATNHRLLKGGDLLPGVHVPQSDRSFVKSAPGGQSVSIGGKRQRINSTPPMPLKGGNLLPGTYVPQSDVRRLIYPPTPGDQGGSIRRKGHRIDRIIGFPHFQGGDRLPARHVPQPGRPIVGPGDKGSPIGRELQGMDEPCLKSPDLFSPPNVPQGDPPPPPLKDPPDASRVPSGENATGETGSSVNAPLRAATGSRVATSHSRISPPAPEARVAPLGDKAIEKTGRCPVRAAAFPVPTSRTSTVPSFDPDARVCPSRENANEKTPLVCSSKVAICRRVATSHSMTVRSLDPDTRVRPSGENATTSTQ